MNNAVAFNYHNYGGVDKEGAMEKKQYKQIKLDSIIKKSKAVPSENALREVVPFPWSKEVLEGNKKVVITRLRRGR